MSMSQFPYIYNTVNSRNCISNAYEVLHLEKKKRKKPK